MNSRYLWVVVNYLRGRPPTCTSIVGLDWITDILALEVDARDPRGFVPLLGRHPGSRSGERLYTIGQQLPVIVIP